jgi:hypothetical protein
MKLSEIITLPNGDPLTYDNYDIYLSNFQITGVHTCPTVIIHLNDVTTKAYIVSFGFELNKYFSTMHAVGQMYAQPILTQYELDTSKSFIELEYFKNNAGYFTRWTLGGNPDDIRVVCMDKFSAELFEDDVKYYAVDF